MRRKRLIIAAAGTGPVPGLAGGVVYATIPSDSNPIPASHETRGPQASTPIHLTEEP